MTDRIQAVISAEDRGASKTFGSLGNKVLTLNQSFELLGKAITAIKAPIAAVINEGRQFGAQMSAVQSVTKANAEQFSAMREEAKRLGETTAFTATEAAAAMENLGRAGQDTGQIIETTGQALNLAAANGVELATAADMIAVQMNIFRKEGLKAQKAADLINQTINASPQNFEQFTYALQYSAGTASSFNRSFEETTQIIGALAEQGVRGSKAGTALNMAFSRLAKPTAEAKKVLDKYGISLESVNPATHEFADIVDILNKANMKQADIFALLGQISAPKFFKLIDAGGDAIRNFALKQKEANTALEAAKVRLDNLEGDITIFKSALSGVKLTIFDAMDKLLRNIVQASTAMLGVFNEFVKNHQTSITNIFTSIGRGIDLAKTSIVFLIRGFADFLRLIADILRSEAVTVMWEQMTTAIKTVVAAVIEFYSKIRETVLENEDFQASLELLKPILFSVVGILGDMFEILGKVISGGYKVLTPLIEPLVKILWKLVHEGLKIVNYNLKKQKEALDKLKEPIKTVKGLFDDLKSVLDDLQELFQNLKTDIYDFVMQGVNRAKIAIDNLKSSMDDLLRPFREVWDFIRKTTDAFKDQEDQVHGHSNTSANKELADTMDDLAKTADKVADKIEGTTKKLKEQEDQTKDTTGALNDMAGSISGSGGTTDGGIDLDTSTGLSGVLGVLTGVMEKIAGNVKGLSGAIAGGQAGGGWGALIGFIADLLLSNESFMDSLESLGDAFAELIEPIAEVIAPVLEAIAPIIKELAPVIKLIARLLKPLLDLDIFAFNNLSKALHEVVGAFEWFGKTYGDPLMNLIAALLDPLQAIYQALTGNSAGDFFENIRQGVANAFDTLKGLFGFQQGTGALTSDQLLRLPGMNSDEGLIKAHVGESIGKSSIESPVSIAINVKSINPREQTEEIRQMLEELFLTRRLQLS